MHKTEAGEKRKILKREALELSRKAKIASKATPILPDASKEARRLQDESDLALAEALSLRDTARLEESASLEDGKGKDHIQGHQEMGFLDGHLARERKDAKFPPWELQKDG